jgi:lysozyme
MSHVEFTKKILRNFEGLKLESYRCSAGIWTIGYGHKGKNVKEGMKINLVQAESFLDSDVSYFTKVIEGCVDVPLSDGQKTAVISFVFNLGESRLKSSTLLKKLNHSEYKEASSEFLRWNKANIDGELRELDGLTKRRQAEKDIFNGIVVEK